MAKLLRISNPSRGKKLILCSDNFAEFSSKIKEKFLLDTDIEVTLTDEHGADIDDEVFPVLCSQASIPDIVFHVKGEISSEISLVSTGPTPPHGSQIIYYEPVSASSQESIATVPAPSSSGFQEIANYRKVLESHISANQEIQNLVADCNEKLFVDSNSASILIKEFVAKLVELKGESPSTNDQKQFALAVVAVVPSWKYPSTANGIDILYDEITRAGLIQNRLRYIHQKLKTSSKNSSSSKRSLLKSCGPKPKKACHLELPSDVDYDELIRQLNGVCTKNGKDELKRLMSITLLHRDQLRSTDPHSVLGKYTKFKECSFLIEYEFNLMHENCSSNFLNLWPRIAPKILEKAKYLSKSPSLAKFLLDESEKWDTSISALFALLYLIPPAAQGKGRGARSKTDDAKQLILSFYKSGTPLKSILDTWDSNKSQPNLVCVGQSTKEIDSFFIIIDRIHIPLEAKTPTEAIDVLFKTHYVFAAEYDKNLQGIWKFLQVYIYKLETSAGIPRKVMEVFSQLSSVMN